MSPWQKRKSPSAGGRRGVDGGSWRVAAPGSQVRTTSRLTRTTPLFQTKPGARENYFLWNTGCWFLIAVSFWWWATIFPFSRAADLNFRPTERSNHSHAILTFYRFVKNVKQIRLRFCSCCVACHCKCERNLPSLLVHLSSPRTEKMHFHA